MNKTRRLVFFHTFKSGERVRCSIRSLASRPRVEWLAGKMNHHLVSEYQTWMAEVMQATADHWQGSILYSDLLSVRVFSPRPKEPATP